MKNDFLEQECQLIQSLLSDLW